jgi:NAD(P)-dependent dehydrogenase (short-subunit alcohol dehydrogenase family)
MRVALVTGCAGGIGAAVCSELLKRGLTVYATDRHHQPLFSFECGSNCRYIQLDVTQPSQVKACVSTIIEEQGRIDLLVNIAGVIVQGPAIDIPLEITEQTFAVNLFGQMRLVQAVTPYMIKQQKGTIVNMGSVLGFTGMPFLSTYSASKAAVQSYTDALRVELSPFGIHVYYAAPGEEYHQ